MLQLLLKTHLAFLVIPLFTLAIEPNNPVTFCDRFLGDADKAACVEKTEKNKSDWYASSACSLLDDNDQFMTCLDEIKDGDYHPEALELCTQNRETTDENKRFCLQKIKNRDYTRQQIKECEKNLSTESITQCLSKVALTSKDSLSAKGRKPASKKPIGFQSSEIRP